MPPPCVSVIVPVFNVGRYIAQCLDSLLMQSLRSLEVIVVNDGSTDGTASIAARYAETYDHVRLINQENQGLSAARNRGMQAASGNYLGFVDGDDWVHPAMYKAMLRKAVGTRADLVITNGYHYSDRTKELKPIQDDKVWASFKDKNCEVALDPRREPDLFMLDTSACKRLYKRQFLDRLGFTFMYGKIFEDVPTQYKLLLNTHAVALLDRMFYFYRTDRPGRITSYSDETLFHVFDVLAAAISDLREKQADEVIWANYIWFQSWVLRWLRNQIDRAHSTAFDSRTHEIGAAFPPEAVEVFGKKFASERKAVDFVKAQVGGGPGSTVKLPPPKVKRQGPKATSHLGNDPIGFFNKDIHTFTPDVWGWICLQYGVRSVLDIGCGIATNLAWFEEYGFEVLGVEGHPRALNASLLPGKVVKHDFSKGPWAPDRSFDLCLCTEFAEHVEAQFEENWMVAVDKCAYLLLSAAPPGQRGYHHVNEQPDAYWIDRFQSRGFRHDPAVTRMLRDTCKRKPASWGRNQLMFFEQGPRA
jgi:glycosyltransferase involved in cell wall biosynthesis/SAM-dependent methyltransferase